MNSQPSSAIENGLTAQLMNRVTPMPRQCSAHLRAAAEVDLQQHRHDHQPDQDRHRQVDLGDLGAADQLERTPGTAGRARYRRRCTGPPRGTDSARRCRARRGARSACRRRKGRAVDLMPVHSGVRVDLRHLGRAGARHAARARRRGPRSGAGRRFRAWPCRSPRADAAARAGPGSRSAGW